ncbi:MAG: DUF429 domain-containing protein [Anaerolineales bacterium]|nr:MAG: DUF429 domain-containing protein [Anaerolineales bacterium]
MGVFIGLDPGGKSAFGWCVARDSPALPLLLVASGVCHAARPAVALAMSAVPAGEPVLAAGIDAPLVWPREGGRAVDNVVRAAIRRAGAPHAPGTVQSVNSLRGACLVQGLLAAVELRDRLPSLPLVEAHPKALRWILPEAQTVQAPSQHERDALLGTFSAWAAIHRPLTWSDLYEIENPWFSPVAPPLHYFMPIGAAQQLAAADPAGVRKVGDALPSKLS